jgi:FMN-dependent NADH-azoreductase
MEETITISKKEYEELLEDQKLLLCLLGAGVHYNWSGYDYAMEMMKEME